jgi:transmembrane sensor
MKMEERNSRQIEREAAEWLARREGSAWTDLDEAQLDAWVAASTAHRVAFLRLESAWAAGGRLKALGAGMRSGKVPERRQWPGLPATDHAVGSQLPVQSILTPRLRTAGLGALATLVIGLALAWGWREFAAIEVATHATAAGEMRTFTLADGSSATLSSASRIGVRIGRGERGIDLQQGEVFFVVAHDPGRPFAVSVGARRAVALGTRFAVRRDPDETRIVVTEGVVRLEAQAPRDGSPVPSATLVAGSMATAHGSSVLVRNGSVADAERLLSWRNGYLIFHDTPLATAVAEFNRYASRPLVIGDASVGRIPIGGNFRWSNSEAFVRLLEGGFGIRAERQADRIVLHSR